MSLIKDKRINMICCQLGLSWVPDRSRFNSKKLSLKNFIPVLVSFKKNLNKRKIYQNREMSKKNLRMVFKLANKVYKNFLMSTQHPKTINQLEIIIKVYLFIIKNFKSLISKISFLIFLLDWWSRWRTRVLLGFKGWSPLY